MSCQSIEKSFVSLNNHDYYSAYNGFNDGLKKDSSACAYGLSLYYNAHVLKNLDSSIRYVLISEREWSMVPEKKRMKFAVYGFDSLSIESQKQALGDQAFLNCERRNSISCFDSIINNQGWNRNIKSILFSRDSLVLNEILNREDLDFSLQMAHEYENSMFMSEIQDAIDLFEYQTYVKSFQEGELLGFLDRFPDNIYVSVAEDSIYSIYLKKNGYRSIDKFIAVHPSNRNISNAWKELYKRYTKNSSPELIIEFEIKYPEYPFKEEINIDSELAHIEYFPFADSSGVLGYSDSTGVWLITPQYDDVSFFYDGIAAVERNEKIGLINKKNELLVDFIFDDIETDADLFVVSAGDFFGVINRNGDFVLDTVYQDVSLLNEGFICAQKDSLYAFYDRSGAQQTAEIYDLVLNFKSGVCPVSINGQIGLIDRDLKLAIPCVHESIYSFSDSLFIMVNKDNFRQLCNRKGKVINDSLFQEIHKAVNGFAICVKDNKVGYLDEQGKQVIENKFDVYRDYDLIGNFIEGKAVAVDKGKFGIIDRSGQFLLKPKYDYIISLVHYFSVKKDQMYAVMDSSFQIITEFEFEAIGLLSDRFILFKKDGKFGLMDLSLNVILDALYTSIYKQDDFIIVSNENGNAVYNDKGIEILPLSLGPFIAQIQIIW